MTAKKPLVLIVDDSPANIQVLAMCLSNSYRIKVAPSGSRCLALLKDDEKPDLILLDIEMPDINGYEVCKIVKNGLQTQDIPVIFVTGREEDEDEEYGLSIGAVDYITKPVRPAIVQARVKTHITLKQQHDKLSYIAMHDQLTGLYNRHFLMEAASKKISHALRNSQPLSFLMVDIDYFKQINDNHGHTVGDRVLKDIAKSLEANTRHGDIVARMGGEEFVVVFNQCPMDVTKQKAEEIRKTIESLHPQDLKVTISIGIAEVSESSPSFDALIQQSDIALYRAKEQGRNRVEVFGEKASD